MPSTIFPIPFRVHVGVTGHRALPQNLPLQQQILDILHRIRTVFHDSPSTPVLFTVVTSLAAGADQEIAATIMQTPGSRLKAVLPFALDDYLSDFETDAQRKRFHELLDFDAKPVCLRAGRALDQDLSAADVRLTRSNAYREAGEYVVRNSDVLIAVWDGESAKGEGGTADIVRYATAQGVPVYIISSVPPFDIESRIVNGGGEDRYHALAMLNTTPLNQARAAARDPSFDNLIRAAQDAGCPAESVARVVECLRPAYLQASQLADRFQRLHFHTGSLVYTLAATVILIATASTLIASNHLLFATGELLGLSLIVYSVIRARKNRHERRWVDFRLLAERLRMAAVLSLCEKEQWLIEIIQSGPRRHSRSDWTSRIVTGLLERIQHTSSQPPPLDKLRNFLRLHWLQNQIEYHRSKAIRLGRRHRHLDLAGETLFYMALAAAVVNVLMIALHLEASNPFLARWLVLGSLALPAFGAAFSGIRKHREYDRLSTKSTAMAAALTELDLRAASADTDERLGRLIGEMCQLVTSEAEDWHTFVRALAVETPS